ncbi:MAG: hypothetical protein ACI4QV_02940 [Acutalibacteraceae bacterium]
MKVSMKTMVIGVAVGMAAGAAAYGVVNSGIGGMKTVKKKMNKTIKNVGEVVDNISSMLG